MNGIDGQSCPSNCCHNKTQMKCVKKIAHIVSEPKVFAPNKMSKILDHLYLGTYDDAVKIDELNKVGITHIINTVEKCYSYTHTGVELYGNEFKYFGFTAEDNEEYPIMDHFEETYKFIEDARQSNGKCLIHCIAGVNRSGVLATAYVMQHKDIGPISAVKHVFDARGILLTNDTFIERLVKLAVEKDMLCKD